MSVATEIYDALCPAVVPDGEAYDTKLPDDFSLAGTALVFQMISDVPSGSIDGTILGYEQRWQVSIYDVDLERARAVKNAVISALHMLSGNFIKLCVFESAQEFVQVATVPPSYHIPLDFIISA